MARVRRAVVHVHDGMGPRLATFARATVQSRSHLLSDAGSAVVTLPQGDAQATGRLIDYDERVYVIESPYGIEPWVGLLVEFREDGQLVTLTLRELPILLANRYTGASEQYGAGLGTVAMQMLRAANDRMTHPFVIEDVADPGPYYAAELRHQKILDQLRGMVTDSLYAWWVDQRVTPSSLTATWRWGKVRGTGDDYVTTLREGIDLVADPVRVNRGNRRVARVTAVGGATPTGTYVSRPQATVEAAEKGPLDAEALVRAEEILNQQAALAAAQAVLEGTDLDQYELGVVDTAQWPKLALAANVRVVLARYGLGAGLDFVARIAELHPDESQRTLTLAVEVV